MMESKFIIYGGGFEWMNACFCDLKSKSNVLFINDQVPIKKRGISRLYAKFCYGLKKAPHVFVLPFFRKVLFKAFSQRKFVKEASSIFFIIFDQNRLDVDFDFLDYLRRIYKNRVHIVYCFTNTFEKSHVQFSYGKGDEIKRHYDLIVSYNKDDCLKFGFFYHTLVYSKLLINFTDEAPLYDCVFVGNCKDRLDSIHSVFLFLKNKGLKCKFYINGVKDNEKIDAGNSIVYNKSMSYNENVSLIRKSKTVLDINQSGASGMNLRVLETIFNGVKLLTNNKFLETNDAIMDNSLVFNRVNEIDVSFFDKPFDFKNASCLKSFYPETFLLTIENYFLKNEDDSHNV